MTSQTGYDYWYLRLPAGPKQKGRAEEEQITDELTELAQRGWEPVLHSLSQYGSSYFTLRKASA